MSTAAISEVAFWGALLFVIAIGVTGSLTGGYYKSEKSRRVPPARSKAARDALRNGDFDIGNAALQKEMKRRAELEVRRGVAVDISTTFAVVGFEMFLSAGYLIGSVTVVVIIVQLLIAAVWVFGLAVRGPRMRRNSRRFLAERPVPDVLGAAPQAPSSLH